MRLQVDVFLVRWTVDVEALRRTTHSFKELHDIWKH